MRCTKALLAVLLLMMLAIPARAAITPESDVVLPWFEIDLARDDIGLATTFSVVNSSPKGIRASFTVYSNWGIPVLDLVMTFDAAEAKTIPLHEWIRHGRLPGRTLTPEELANLQAVLTGKPSPLDGLYYGSAVSGNLAIGYVIVRTLDDRPDVLWGDTHSIDLEANYFDAETLNALTHGLSADCNHHGIRWTNEGLLYDGDELIVWSGRRFSPSPNPTPIGPKMKFTVRVFDQSGRYVRTCYRELLAVESVLLCHDIEVPIGWLEITTEDPTFIHAHLHSTTRASAALHSYCLRQEARIEGPAITLEKKVEENDADRAPGPKFAAGVPLEFQFYVTNSGSVTLTGVGVTDDQGLEVTCPKASLEPAETMVCTAQATALGCLNINWATASAAAADGKRVSAEDVAYYTGEYEPNVSLELLVNGAEADDPTGPSVVEGAQLDWTFVVTNTGNVRLTGIAVELKHGEPVTCPATELDPGQSMTCTALSLAGPGQRHETATVSAADPCDDTVVATDPAYYFGRSNNPAIVIEKYVGESDADTPPGPAIAVGSTIQWRYVVTNTGNVPLTGIVVVDDDGLVPQCPKNALEPGESMTCTASSTALPCDHANTATASGTASDPEKTVTASDPANYVGQGHPAVELELLVNGDPADTPFGPWIDENGAVDFTFMVTNTGDVELTSLVVSTDSDLTALCPKTALAPGEAMTCTAATLAVAGTHDVIGSVYGRGPCGESVQADDPAYYRGRALVAGIDLVKMINGQHADTPTGPSLPIGSAVTWTYLVTNTGTVALTGVTVTDDQGVPVTCPKTALEPGESMTCTASGIAAACQYHNVATAQGQPTSGGPVTAVDESYYLGQHRASISIDKKTNGEDAALPPGPVVTTGTTVQWTYAVTNTGDVTLTGIAVTDDRAGAVSCPKTALEPAESMACTASGVALAGPQRNVGTATGTPPCGAAVSATDASNYLGVTPGIAIEKLINGLDADDAAHAVQLGNGAEVRWSFVVTNTGDVLLADVSVTDDKVTTVTCPKTTLEVGEAMTCTASGIAEPGLDCDTGTAAGTSPQGVVVTATDSACYTGATAAIAIEKRTNGFDADTPPGPQINVETTVTWTYIVTNTGEVALTGVTVTDDQGVTVTCPKTALQPGESMTCTASGFATTGQYANIGTATGTPPSGPDVTASDPSHYLGVLTGNQGCTPGYWKNHTDSWPPAGYSPTQTVKSVFASATAFAALGNATLLDSLGFAGGPGVDGAAEILLRAATAALLNASHPSVGYPRLPGDVITDVDSALASNDRDTMLALAAALDADNNLGCPLN